MKKDRVNKIIMLLRIFMAAVFTLCAIFLIYKVGVYFSQNKENQNIKNEFELDQTITPTISSDDINITQVSNNLTDVNSSTKKSISISQEKAIQIYLQQPIKKYNHDGLKNENTDYRAWIDIPGTSISYPVVQSKDNEDYLSYSFSKQKRSSGCIFIDANIRNCNTCKNLVIYGHNMKSGSMFAMLPSYRNIDYYNKHPFIYLYFPDGVKIYQVISAYVTIPEKEKDLVYQTTFSDQNEYKNFLDDLVNRSLIKTTAPISFEKSIITLSTCVNHSSKRFVVHAMRFQ